MVIKNAVIFGDDETFRPGEVAVEDGKIVECASSESEVIDAQGGYVIPGLIDIHFHGCMGADMCDGTAEALDTIAAYEGSVGVTSIAPATMTVSEEDLHGIMKNAALHKNDKGAKLVGINMEGPFISKAKKGAQADDHIRQCDVALFRSLQQDANGLIKLVDIAPETDGAMDFIDAVKDEVVVSIAHTEADYDTAKEAYDRGARHATHLYNAMPAFSHRAPGVIGAACDTDKCRVELICDGVHIHPSVVRTTFRMFGSDRMIMISDSMRATGLSDGEYTLGGQPVYVTGNRATLKDGTIAGSATNLMDCVRVAVHEMGIPLETAVKCASVNPAKEIGIFDQCGSITVGKDADLVILNKDLSLQAVYIGGVKQ